MRQVQILKPVPLRDGLSHALFQFQDERRVPICGRYLIGTAAGVMARGTRVRRGGIK